jgi:2-haloacid dehalogenase
VNPTLRHSAEALGRQERAVTLSAMADRWATFDCYGTLIDWELGIARVLAELWPDINDATIGRLVQERDRAEAEIERGSFATYREVLRESLRRVAEQENLLVPEGMENAFADSLPTWPPFEEVPDALSRLRSRGWKLGILSNTDPDLLDATIDRIGVAVDVRITAQDAGSYKPAHGHWVRFEERVRPDNRRHVHVAASPFADLAPCAELGMTAVWINREHGVTNLPRVAELPDLRDLPSTLDALVPEA